MLVIPFRLAEEAGKRVFTMNMSGKTKEIYTYNVKDEKRYLKLNLILNEYIEKSFI